MKKLTEAQFHSVWTEAVGKEGYDKKLFQSLLQSMKDKGLIYTPNKNKERILCSAIIWNGVLVAGYRHSDCYETVQDLSLSTGLPDEIPHGFLTSHKRYVSREEGYAIALENNQLFLKPKEDEVNELISEDLYHDPEDFFGLTKKIYG